jgi:DNA recombination protein RmuC
MQQELERKEEAKLNALKNEVAASLAQEMMRMWQQVQGQVQTTEQSVSQKLQQANDTFSTVTRELGRLQESTRRVEEVGRNVAKLEDLLRAPKMQGGFGELFLADLLAQVLPANFYELQHEFSNREKVDAAIRLQNRLVPVDSKFPIESFKRMSQAVTDEERLQWRKQMIRDIKKHIDDIAAKYIRPGEGTFEFALMYIPAENIYYESVIRDVGGEDGVFQHAVRRQVIPVSPNSFYAYLQVILQGLRGFEVEKKAAEILQMLQRLEKELKEVREDFDKAGKQLQFARDNFDKAEKHLARFEGRLELVKPGSSAISDESEPAALAPLKGDDR